MLTDDEKKVLTEFLGERATVINAGGGIGYTNVPQPRDFDCEPDMMALYQRLCEKGDVGGIL